MKLIVDGGSTKTKWIFIKGDNSTKCFITKGINPYFQSTEQIVHLIKESGVFIESPAIEYIYYYGAGCANEEKSDQLKEIFISFAKNATVSIESDLLAAARSLFKDKDGVAAILGTGANSGYYDGKNIIDHTPALGYILGDEGSGASIGKRLATEVFKKQLSNEICEKFKKRFDLNESSLLENVYKKEFPNRFLASLSVFITENKNESSLTDLLRREFDLFFVRNILPYPKERRSKIGFIGSIAFYYQDILKESAKKFDIEIIDICREPSSGLIEFHKYPL
ncbi:MAG: ATPase [Bacteroidales bacterium]|nr:ATPase [Bacteroidales bacterium]